MGNVRSDLQLAKVRRLAKSYARWFIYGLVVTVAFFLLIAGIRYKPPQIFNFAGQMTSGGGNKAGTKLSFQVDDQTPRRIVTTRIRGLAGIEAPNIVIRLLNTPFTSCSDIDQSLITAFVCTKNGDIIGLSTDRPIFAIEFDELVTVEMFVQGSGLVSFEESRPFGDFPFSRNVMVSTTTAPGLQRQHAIRLDIKNQPGTEVSLDVNSGRRSFVPSKSTRDEQPIEFSVDFDGQSTKSQFKLLYPDSELSFDAEYPSNRICLSKMSGVLDVGGKQIVATPTETWHVEADSPGSLSIINRQVLVGFEEASKVILAQDACGNENPPQGSDRRRSWLGMHPTYQGALGFILSALVLSPFIKLLLPKQLRD